MTGTVEWTPAVAALVERAQAEARAKALEEAAKVAEALDFHDEYDDVRIAAAIRSLIPKPVEGA